MNILKKYYEKEYGSIKGYLFLEMQISIIIAVLISIYVVFVKDYSYLMLEVIPILLLTSALYEFRKNFKKDFTPYTILFGFFLTISILAPMILDYFIIVMDPIQSIRNTLYIAIIILIFYIIFRMSLSRKVVEGKVLMSEKGSAVVSTDFDLLAGVKAGKYVVKTGKRKPRKGQKVKLYVKRSFFRSPKPVSVV